MRLLRNVLEQMDLVQEETLHALGGVSLIRKTVPITLSKRHLRQVP